MLFTNWEEVSPWVMQEWDRGFLSRFSSLLEPRERLRKGNSCLLPRVLEKEKTFSPHLVVLRQREVLSSPVLVLILHLVWWGFYIPLFPGETRGFYVFFCCIRASFVLKLNEMRVKWDTALSPNIHWICPGNISLLDSEGAKSTCDPFALTKVVFWPSLWMQSPEKTLYSPFLWAFHEVALQDLHHSLEMKAVNI